jgi:hypothetical protein
MVLHRDAVQGTLHMVDGQQRFLTLQLLVMELRDIAHARGHADLGNRLSTCADHTIPITQPASRDPLRAAIRVIRDDLAGLSDDHELVALSTFLLGHCEMMILEVTDLPEAFQCFDSHNARGRPLHPHDLLKAFHYRCLLRADPRQVQETIHGWESRSGDDVKDRIALKDLFAHVLFPIRRWSSGQPSITFTSGQTGAFKGVNLYKDEIEKYPCLRILHICDVHAQNGNQYPFQITQVIINGGRFFQMVEHYAGLWEKVVKPKIADSSMAFRILKTIESYSGRHRFGFHSFDQAVIVAFKWSYRLRLTSKAIRASSINKHVLGQVPEHLQTGNPFAVIATSMSPEPFLNHHLPQVSIETTHHTQDIVGLFRDLRHIIDT